MWSAAATACILIASILCPCHPLRTRRSVTLSFVVGKIHVFLFVRDFSIASLVISSWKDFQVREMFLLIESAYTKTIRSDF